MSGLELAVVAPSEVAELLVERMLADLPQVIPMEWHRLLADMDVAERTPVAGGDFPSSATPGCENIATEMRKFR